MEPRGEHKGQKKGHQPDNEESQSKGHQPHIKRGPNCDFGPLGIQFESGAGVPYCEFHFFDFTFPSECYQM